MGEVDMTDQSKTTDTKRQTAEENALTSLRVELDRLRADIHTAKSICTDTTAASQGTALKRDADDLSKRVETLPEKDWATAREAVQQEFEELSRSADRWINWIDERYGGCHRSR